MKGILLAGGTGSRLFPATVAVNKHLLPVYDKPMIYYSLSMLMLAEIREILLICRPKDLDSYQYLFGNGARLGLSIQYVTQEYPEGLAQAFILGESFLAGEPCCMVLGDNIFYGHGLAPLLKAAKQSIERDKGALVFGYRVNNPSQYGVANFDKSGRVTSIEEKPSSPSSNFAVTGLYFYDGNVANIAKTVKPSKRGELEISCINQHYVNECKLKIQILGRGFAWLDTGTHISLNNASQFISSIETRQGIKVACLEEIAFAKGWISEHQLMEAAKRYQKTEYGNYIDSIYQEKCQKSFSKRVEQSLEAII